MRKINLAYYLPVSVNVDFGNNIYFVIKHLELYLGTVKQTMISLEILVTSKQGLNSLVRGYAIMLFCLA